MRRTIVKKLTVQVEEASFADYKSLDRNYDLQLDAEQYKDILDCMASQFKTIPRERIARLFRMRRYGKYLGVFTRRTILYFNRRNLSKLLNCRRFYAIDHTLIKDATVFLFEE
jgi:hypothetical protein